ncbi:DUF1207 domain-containing protein [Magnetospirillum sp. UT-4]|uniref:DUF1207 domain-containing protein n=1 Tax=Magnetospirillum sp. UT-4 TaxID=2681467 RepID=UPI001383E538|nr:DUF1207 domain-containing protein [Magnetospirillum sp. UT-4]CAA7625774.1 conserved exported hypothetical protein [Magnetospirillum sp. UT-4]
MRARWAAAVLTAMVLADPCRAAAADAADGATVLPREILFAPLLADPRWPHYAAALQDYGGHAGLGTVGQATIGDSFSFYQAPAAGGRWGIGLQVGVFAIFDLEAPSKDLINADYWVGLPLAWRRGPWSALARLYHQSSHLGDEYLLRSRDNQRNRINLSYEAVDLKLSRDFAGGALRLYGGGGVLFDQEPSDIRRGMAQAGIELRGPWSFADGLLRPIAALDLQALEETGWGRDVSARLGVELVGSGGENYTLQLSLDYYRGRNPNGQFFVDKAEYWGLGLHAYF